MFRNLILFSLLSYSYVFSQESPPPTRHREAAKEVKPSVVAASPKAAKSRRFVMDVVNSAVALPQTDQQDRLRVLSSAVEVVSPIAPKTAAELSREGVRIEAELIAAGQRPAASLFTSGQVDCKTATDFSQRIYPQNLAAAEQSLIGVLMKCPKQAGEIVRTKADAALEQDVLVPHLLMTLINLEAQDPGWAQRAFRDMFSSLPEKAGGDKPRASDFATMLAATAPKIDKDTVRDAGLKLLRWLGKQDDSGDKNLAINIVASAMKEALGKEGYKRALERDVIAQQVASLEGAPGRSSREEEESVSVAQSMTTMAVGSDQREQLKALPASMRARQAAAYGFAKGKSGDKPGAWSYFDVAFSAADEAWADRGDKNVAPLIQEVSEAAAQVDPMDALRRAQGLQDPSAKAIGMIAVARVVLSKDLQL
jgi:hypothetical protein